MRQDQIVSAVRESTSLRDADTAQAAVRATLQVLGQRLAGGQPRHVAAELPPALAEVLPEQGPGERFDVDEFYRRVAAQEAATPRQARQHSRAVLAALKVAIPHEFDDLAAQLPADYGDLLSTGPVEHH